MKYTAHERSGDTQGVTRERFDAFFDENGSRIEGAIHDLWASKDDERWSREPYFYVKLGETADRLGQSMFAHDVFKEAFGCFPDHPRIAQLYALSLIKCGYAERARALLTDLAKRGHRDEETLGILGRVYKDMWLAEGKGDPKHPHILKSRELYLRAFARNKGYYSGINAASLSLIVGDAPLASKLARLVLAICVRLLGKGGGPGKRKPPGERNGGGYWVLATLGEACLILGDQEKAAKYYGFAKRAGRKNYSELASTRRQLRLLQGYIPVSDAIMEALTIPATVAFAGHMVDRPGARRARFPAWLVPAVKEEIATRLERLNAGIGYSSAACGSDVLFLEAMHERRAETNVILPFNREDFFKTSVEHAGPEWVGRARAALDGSSRIVHPTEGKYGGDDFLFSYANKLIMGEAILRGSLLESTPTLLAVWDGKRNGSEGGTSEFVWMWGSRRLPVEIVDVGEMRKRAAKAGGAVVVQGLAAGSAAAGGPAVAGHAAGETPAPGVARRGRRPPTEVELRVAEVKRAFKTMLFADLVGYSKLTEEQLPYFYGSFLCEMAANLRRSGYKPVFRNSWGDCVFLVFEDPISAAEYALELRDFVKGKDWRDSNLPAGMSIRIGLHAGPVYSAWEPILNRMSFFGSHVTTAARIEPITSPGNVYASEQFAALLAAEEGSGGLECRYVGVVVLPKEFGKYPIFHIKRRGEIG